MSATPYYPPFQSNYSTLSPSVVPSTSASNNVPIIADAAKSANDAPASTDVQAPADKQPKECSVRGCTKPVPPDAGTKMCEVCRSRHRVYAMTKRQKRKMEKAAVSMQSLGQLATAAEWSTEITARKPSSSDPSTTPVAGPSTVSPVAAKLQERASVVPEVHSAPAPSWNQPALDPRFYASRSSELAGALTLHGSDSNNDRSPGATNQVQSATGTQSAPHQASHDLQRASVADGDPKAGSSTAGQTSSPYPPRFCSVKGCKAIIPGDYFFKMCEPCRDRYRGYGITKRAKWKRERVETDAELESLREAEDKRRAEAGLPPLSEAPEDEWNAWEKSLDEWQPQVAQDPAQALSMAVHMCTVSHCHKLLPGHYKFRRCEQHRLQNRHHSKLKRVREKETKAQGPVDGFRNWKPQQDGQEDDGTEPLTRELREVSTDSGADTSVDTADQVSVSSLAGVPPPARGSRRTNHVCSVKICFNLLAPDVPWKMCDTCRAHDRLARKNKRLQNGKMGTGDETDLVKLDDGTVDDLLRDVSRDADTAEPPDVISAVQHDPTLIFTDPLLPERSTSSQSRPRATPIGSASGSSLAPHTLAMAQSAASSSLLPAANAIATSGTSPLSAQAPNISATAQARKVSDKSANAKQNTPSLQNTMPPTSLLSGIVGGAVQQQPMPPAMYPSPAATMQPMYQVPYYMPPPFGMPPFNAMQQGPQPVQPPHPGYSMQTYSYYPPYAGPPYQAQQPFSQYPYMPQQMQPQMHPQHMQPPPQTQLQPQQVQPQMQQYRVQPTQQSQPHQQPPASLHGPTQQPYVPQAQYDPNASYYRRVQFQPTVTPTSTTEKRKKRKRVMGEEALLSYQEQSQRQELAPGGHSTGHSASFSVMEFDPAPEQGRHPSESSSGMPASSASPDILDDELEIMDEHSHIDDTSGKPRECGNKYCHRMIPRDLHGSLCDRCQVRFKKHQVKAKQRFRLEPRKGVMNTA